MNNKLKSIAGIVIIMLVISSCTDKVDSALNKEEAAISRYEKKAASHEATPQDLQDLQTKVNDIAVELKNITEKDITPEQMQRGQQLSERYEQIMMNNAFDVNSMPLR